MSFLNAVLNSNYYTAFWIVWMVAMAIIFFKMSFSMKIIRGKEDKIALNPLPMNMPEFKAWSLRIITEAQLPTKNIETQEFALAGMILQSDPTQFFRPDQYYIDALRKAASDQLATQVIEDMRNQRAQAALLEKQKSEATLNQKGVVDEEKQVTT